MEKVRKLEGNRLAFRCPGCDEIHGIMVGNEGWTWNGSLESPTFQPSILSTGGHYASTWKQGDACWCTYNASHPDDPAPFKCERCHSYVIAGKIQFLADCSHALANQTVEIPEWDE